jgi:hypothetical protein
MHSSLGLHEACNLSLSLTQHPLFYFFVLPEATIKMVGKRVSNKKWSPLFFLCHYLLLSVSVCSVGMNDTTLLFFLAFPLPLKMELRYSSDLQFVTLVVR